jgi:uncharacterized OB-fold protein
MTGVPQVGFVPPAIDEDSRAWWQAVSERRLLLPRCGGCGLTWFPPAPGCPRCGGAGISLREASGRGRIYSWVVVERALDPVFARDVPYTIVAVDLDEGARMVGRLLAPAGAGWCAGTPVRASFYEVEGQALVGFELDGPAPG